MDGQEVERKEDSIVYEVEIYRPGGDTRTARTMEVGPMEEHGQPLPAPEEPEVEGPMPCGRDEESVGTTDRAGESS